MKIKIIEQKWVIEKGIEVADTGKNILIETTYILIYSNLR